MPESLPDWFAADQVYAAADGFYIGAANGFRVGPFPSRAQAEQQGRELRARLQRCRNTSEWVRLLRRFIIDQTHKHGRGVRATPSTMAHAPPPTTGAVIPPVRTGERPRVWFRTHRVFAVGDAWFFTTREGLDIGPYASREEARNDAERLQNILRAISGKDASRRAIEQFAAQGPAREDD